MPILTVDLKNGEKQEIRCERGARLSELIRMLPGAPKFECGGRGVCGKCAVRARGGISPLREDGTALSCAAVVLEDAFVDLSDAVTVAKIETDGFMPQISMDPAGKRFGEALDIGTTTMALKLFSFADGKLLSTVACENPQRRFAADVIGRITAVLEGHGKEMRDLVRNAERDLLGTACSSAGISVSDVDAKVITGNTSMLYFYTGRDPEPLSHAPFLADSLFGFVDDGILYPPCFSAFVGADISCAVLASEMTEHPETSLLVDLGTNGEIVLWHNGTLHCCSTAAGPAFEGSSISCGSMSVSGAIDRVWIEDGSLRVHTIGEGEPFSICGSGLIDAIACLLDRQLIDETGKIPDDYIHISDHVFITQKDIRQVQMAKSAVYSGILTVLEQTGVSMEEVETLYLAGGFGEHLSIANAVEIGLIPAELAPKVKTVGNAALAGAAMLLLDRKQTEKIREMGNRAVNVNLAGNSLFSENFINNMLFGNL